MSICKKEVSIAIHGIMDKKVRFVLDKQLKNRESWKKRWKFLQRMRIRKKGVGAWIFRKASAWCGVDVCVFYVQTRMDCIKFRE